MVSVPPEAPPRKQSRLVLPVLAYLISAACLILVYWGFDWKTELPKFMAVDKYWLALAVLMEFGTYVCQGWRWQLLLKPLGPSRFFRSVQAVYVGLFANAVLPFRSGEIIRAYLQARWVDIPFALCLSSVLIERLFDGILLVMSFYAVAVLMHVPRYLRDAALVLAVGVAGLSVLLGIVMFYKHHAHAAVSKSRWAESLRHLVEGLHAMGNSRWFYASAGASVLYLVTQLIPVYALMKASDLDLSVGAAAVVLVILKLGTVLPQAPSNVGGVQFFTVVGMRMCGVDKTTATSFATIVFFAMTVPLLLGGAIATAMAGRRIKDLHRHAQASLQTVGSQRTGP